MSNYDVNLQARLREFCGKKQAGSMTKAAQAIGVSTALISTYLASKYAGDVDEVQRKLREFFAVLDARQLQPSQFSDNRVDPRIYRPTSISEYIYNTIRYCQLERSITIIHGPSGVGKTMAAAKYAKDNPSTAVYVEVSPVTGVLSRFVKHLAKALRIQPARDMGVTVAEIKAKLRGSNIVLIIDEAQHLRNKALEEIRNWTQYDPITGEAGVGIALVGSPQIYRQMQGRNSDLYEQQFNRSRPVAVNRKQITHEDVLQIFPAAEALEGATEFLLNVCRSQWSIRNATLIWNDAVNSEDVSAAKLQQIAQSRNILVA